MKGDENISCENCPYIKEEYEYRKKILQDEDVQYSCWCDKVGGKIWHFGTCSDNFDSKNQDNKRISKYVKRSKHERNKRYKNKMRNLTYNVRYISCPIRPVDKNGEYDDKNPAYFKRYSVSIRRSYLQRQSNKKIRKVPVEENISNGCNYKKYFDLKWSYGNEKCRQTKSNVIRRTCAIFDL